MLSNMLSNMDDRHIETLLRVAKKNKALRPFFSHPKGMITLRQEAYKRGIFGSNSEASRVCSTVFEAMEDHRHGGVPGKK
jgi:hypothetical protein